MKMAGDDNENKERSSWTERFGCGFMAVWLLMGIPQTLAVFAYLTSVVGLTLIIFAWPIALFLAMLPVAGPVLGVLGAAKVWGWSWSAAVLFFVAPWFLTWFGSICFGIADIKKGKR